MKRIICVCMAFLLLLTGCQSSQDTVEEETTNNTASMESFDDTYYNIVKFEDSELREDFYLDYGATSDFSSIGRGLQILSSQYFSTSDHYMSEGQYLKLALKQEMVKRDSDYSYSLLLEQRLPISVIQQWFNRFKNRILGKIR